MQKCRKQNKQNNIAVYAGTLTAGIILWHFAALILQLPFIPQPAAVLKNTWVNLRSQISVHILYSLWRVSAGLALSVAIGVPTGLCMGYFKRLDSLLSPVVYFLYPIPKIALIPLIMLVFGLGETAKISMILLIVVFQVIVASRDAAGSIPQETFHSLYSLGAGKLRIFQKVIVPACLPGLLTSLRISLGTAMSVLFFSETFGTQYGMGFFIMDAWMRVNYVDMFSGIFVLSILGFVLFLFVDFLEKTLCRWKR